MSENFAHQRFSEVKVTVVQPTVQHPNIFDRIKNQAEKQQILTFKTLKSESVDEWIVRFQQIN